MPIENLSISGLRQNIMQIKNKKWKNIVVLVLTGTLFILVFEIIPRLLDNADLVYRFIVQKYKVGSIQNIEEEISRCNLENKALMKQTGFIVSNYERDKNISNILSIVDSAAFMSKTSIREIKPSKIIKQNNLLRQTVDIYLSAGYENFYNMLRFLESSSKVMVVRGFLISSGKNDKDDLNIKLELEVYLNI